jgi:hypothetical protein
MGANKNKNKNMKARLEYKGESVLVQIPKQIELITKMINRLTDAELGWGEVDNGNTSAEDGYDFISEYYTEIAISLFGTGVVVRSYDNLSKETDNNILDIPIVEDVETETDAGLFADFIKTIMNGDKHVFGFVLDTDEKPELKIVNCI